MATKNRKLIATHVKCEDGDAVCVHSLRVLIEPDGAGWFAQGLEIDYAAGGDAIDDVKKRFEKGLRATIQEHLRVYGNIDRLMAPAPQEEWQKFANQAKQHVLTMVSLLQNDSLPDIFPYTNIAFMQTAVATQ